MKPPPRSLLLLEGPRALAEAATFLPSLPILLQARRGDGHPVLVLPGYIADDGSTRVLRTYLRSLGYRAHRWTLGRNLGAPDQVMAGLMARLGALHERYQRTVSLVGWSLGGIYARELAKYMPGEVRQVVSLGSPFGGGRGGHHAASLRRILDGREPTREELEWRKHLWAPPPVPATAIFSRSDGVAAWRACMELPSERTDNIEVSGSHCGLGFNPLVLYAIADRLAQPEYGWQPFARRGVRRCFYPDPLRPPGSWTQPWVEGAPSRGASGG